MLTHCAWFVPADLRIKEVCNTEHAPASVEVDALRFRPNLVLSGSLPNDEDNWQTVSICNQQFTVCRQNPHLFTKSLSPKFIYSLKSIEPVAECGLGTHCPPLASGLTLKGFIITGRLLWIFVGCMAGARRLQPVSNGEHRPSHWFPSQSESTTGNFGFLSQGWGRDFLLDSWVYFFCFWSLAYIFCKTLCVVIYLDTALQRWLCISIMLNDPDFNHITWIGNNYILHLFSLTKWLYMTLLQSLCVCVGGGMVVGKDNIRYLIDTRQLWQHSWICRTEFHSWTGDWLCQMVTCNIWKTIVSWV